MDFGLQLPSPQRGAALPTVYSAVKLDEFGAELCAGRPMSMDCIPNLVLLDEVLVGSRLDRQPHNPPLPMGNARVFLILDLIF